jgi:hypothetical protein
VAWYSGVTDVAVLVSSLQPEYCYPTLSYYYPQCQIFTVGHTDGLETSSRCQPGVLPSSPTLRTYLLMRISSVNIIYQANTQH